MNVKTLKASTLTALSMSSVLLFHAALARGQSQSQYDKGTPPQHAVGVSALGSYTSTELGTINLSNGALNFKIPLGSIGGRGGISLPLTLNYSSKVWSASIDSDMDRETSAQASVAYADYDAALGQGSFLQTMIGAGWTIGTGPSLEPKRVLIGRIPSGPNAGCYAYTLTKLTLYLPDRGEIELRDDATNGAPLASTCTNPASRGTRWHATDGSGVIFINDVDNGVAQWPSPNCSGVVVTADGTRIRFGANGGMTDRNGNKVVGLTDQLGRITTIQSNVPDPQYPYGPLAWLVTIPGYEGQNRYYKIKKGVMNQNYRSGINPALPVITGDWDPESWGYNWWGTPTRLFLKSYGLYAQRIDDIEVLTELVLPDGRSLKFKYNQFGEVAEAEFPTGGKVQYDYGYAGELPTGNSPVWETGTGGTGGGITTDVKHVDRAVKDKRTYPDGVTLEGRWSYAYGAASSSVSVWSSANSLLSDEMHYFLGANRYTEYPYAPGNHDGTHYSLWSTGVEWRSETRNAAGAVIAATEQDWTQRTPVSWVGYPTEQPAQDNRVNQHRKYLDTGVSARVDTFYDQYNNPTEVKEYDFDQTLKRRAVTSYLTTNNGYNYATDDSIHLLRLPSQQSVYDAGGTERARTVYEYDNYVSDGLHAPIVDYGSVTQHDSAYGPGKLTRGNLTAVGNWLNTTGTTIYSYMRYDKLGNVVSTTDPKGNVSSVSFTDDFGNGSNPGSGVGGTYGATYALPTLITSTPPQPGAPVHTARSQYDFSTGLHTGFRDRNNIVTQTIYNDAFNRPTSVKSAVGVSGVETHAAMYYAPTATPFGITLAKNDVLTATDQTTLDDAALRSWSVTDGFGRTTETWSRDPQGDVKTVSNYDGLGRLSQTSNPFRPSLGETAVYTTTAYDLAGRVISVTTPDNAAVTTAYSGNTVTVTDQAVKKRKSVTDGLGRLKEVYEDPTGLNYLTGYSYDVLDNLTTVSQGAQTRTFVYNSLKRLTSATNPESGTISYQYDNNGNLTQKNDARGVVANYLYDALNRNTSVSYLNDPSGTLPLTRVYDLAVNGKGRLYQSQTTGATGSLTTTDSYDALGRPLTQRQQFYVSGAWSQSYTTQRSHNLAGAVISQTYPSGRTVSYGYDSAGRTSAFTGNLGDSVQRSYASAMTYSPLGGMTKEAFGTDTTLYHKLQYNVRGQLWDIRVSTAADVNGTWNRGALQFFYDQTYSFGGSGADNNGNVLAAKHYRPLDEQSATWAISTDYYGYDSLNRISSVSEYYVASGQAETQQFQQSFSCDRYGNRTIIAGSTWGVGINNKQFDVSTTSNRLTVPSGQIGTMTYDSAGNLITDTYTGAGSRTYDAENRMTQAWGGNNQWQYYTYSADGQRVRRKVDSTETWQVYGIAGELLAEYAANGSTGSPQKEYGYRNGQLLVTAEPAAQIKWLVADQLGTPRIILDKTGALANVKRHDYLPFGEELFAGTGGRTTALGYSGDNVRQKFTSKERDNETGLDYFGARYYGSTQGRFTSADPIMIKRARLLDPQRINLYAYVRNNPLKFIDPDGADLVLAESLKPKQREFIVKNLARLYMTEKGRAIIERVDKSPFLVTLGRAELTRKDLNPAKPGETKFGGTTYVVGGVTQYDSTTDPKTKEKTLIANGSKETEMFNPIQVAIDKDNSSDIGKDPAKVMAHELGGHTIDLLNLAERPGAVGTPGFDITGYNDKDETSSEKAEKLGKLPGKPTDEAIKAVEEILKKKERP